MFKKTLKSLFIVISLLSLSNGYSNQDKEISLINKVDKITLNLTIENKMTRMKDNSSSYPYELKEDTFKIIDINDPTNGVLFPINIGSIRILLNIAGSITNKFYYYKSVTYTSSVGFINVTDEYSTNAKAGRLSVYGKYQNYYLGLTSIILQYKNDLSINYSQTLNKFQGSNVKKIDKLYFKINALKELDFLKLGFNISNFIKIDIKKGALTQDDFDEIAPYMLSPIFRNPFYRFNEIYEDYFFGGNFLNGAMYQYVQAKEYNYHTDIIRFNPYALLTFNKINIETALTLTKINYNYSFYYKDTNNNFYIGDFFGNFLDYKANINIILNLQKDLFINNIILRTKTSIKSKLDENRAISASKEKIKFNYGYTDIFIRASKNDEFGYYIDLRFLKCTSSIFRTGINTNVIILYFLPYSSLYPFFSSDSSTFHIIFSNFDGGIVFNINKVKLNFETGLEVTSVGGWSFYKLDFFYGMAKTETQIFSDLKISLLYKVSFIIKTSFYIINSQRNTYDNMHNLVSQEKGLKSPKGNFHEVSLAIEYKF